ncbi:MAG: hypothetical protein QOH97_2772 [Actinoplanes sp.]|jgi:hypothetical protein|nr:hypothetical protein [Actinoplanes sp.]
MISGFSLIRAADCRAVEGICIPIRLASRWRSGVALSGARCDSPVFLTPVRWQSTSMRPYRRREPPMVGRWSPTRLQGRTTDMSTR